jgi:hypothetical protein
VANVRERSTDRTCPLLRTDAVARRASSDGVLDSGANLEEREMSRLGFVALAVALAACASAPAKQVPTIAAAPGAASCPLYVVDGVAQSSTCTSSKKTVPAKCEANGPLYVVDGVVIGCARPEGSR